MRKYASMMAGGAAMLMGGALLLAAGGASAASVSERICDEMGGVWDKATKTCVTVEEERPGNNNGNAVWETEQTDTAHGNLKNPKSTSESSCDGPGNSTSHC